MANQKVTELTEITSIASDDLIYVVDASDMTDGPDGSSKSIQAGNLLAFSWTTSEQVWPFEKDVGGATIYAKAFAVAAYPNNTTSNTAHGITGLLKTLQLKATITNASAHYIAGTAAQGAIYIDIQTTNIRVVTTTNFSTFSGTIYMLYTKS